MEIGAELLTTLAYRQFALGQSAILDSPAEDVTDRDRWHSLAAHAGAVFVPVRCVCSDLELHRLRVEDRTRGIPGWHDPGDWSDVVERTAAFPAWEPDAVVVDTAGPLEQAVDEVVTRVRSAVGDLR